MLTAITFPDSAKVMAVCAAGRSLEQDMRQSFHFRLRAVQTAVWRRFRFGASARTGGRDNTEYMESGGGVLQERAALRQDDEMPVLRCHLLLPQG